MVIKWINRFSRETGYIKTVDYKNKHFNNTFNYTEAKKFNTIESANKCISKLEEYGEGINNEFEVVE
jgi:hypothetical protein